MILETKNLIDYYDNSFDPISEISSNEEFSNWLNIIDETIEDGLTIPQAIDTLYLVIDNLIEKEYYEWCSITKKKIEMLELQIITNKNKIQDDIR